MDHLAILGPRDRAQFGTLLIAPPCPGVAEPEGRQQPQRRGVSATIGGGNADHHVIWSGLRILDHDVKIAILGEHTRIEELILRRAASTTLVLLEELRI